MKKNVFAIILLSVVLAFGACKSNKGVVVNATAQFNPDEVWLLSEMQGKEVAPLEGQKKISIQFNPEAGTFQGHSGCNRYFGNFKDLGKGKMELSELNATKMACAESFHKMEGAYMALLRRCDGYNLGEYTLELTQKGKVLISFEKYRQ